MVQAGYRHHYQSSYSDSCRRVLWTDNRIHCIKCVYDILCTRFRFCAEEMHYLNSIEVHYHNYLLIHINTIRESNADSFSAENKTKCDDINGKGRSVVLLPWLPEIDSFSQASPRETPRAEWSIPIELSQRLQLLLRKSDCRHLNSSFPSTEKPSESCRDLFQIIANPSWMRGLWNDSHSRTDAECVQNSLNEHFGLIYAEDNISDTCGVTPNLLDSCCTTGSFKISLFPHRSDENA